MLSNYPAGAKYDPIAPYNEPSPPDPKEFSCIVTETMQKEVGVSTSNYREYYEQCEEGTDHWFEFDDVDWDAEYNENGLTLPDILTKCNSVLQKVKDMLLERKDKNNKQLLRLVDTLIDATDGWEFVEREIELDD